MKTNLLTITILGLALTLMSCGKSSNKSDSAQATVTGNGILTSDSIAYCNYKANSTTSMNLQSYADSNGQIRRDLTQIKLNQAHTQFYTAGTKIQFFRWRANSANQTDIDVTPLQIQVYNRSTGAAVFNANYVTWADISGSGSNITDFTFLVDTRDMNGDYQVLRTVTYTSAGNVVSVLDALNPEFAAHPTQYATAPDGSARSSLLTALHPFQGYSSYSAADLATHARQYCF